MLTSKKIRIQIIFALILILGFSQESFANHLKGGWIQYVYMGSGTAANTSRYQIIVRQYLDCNSTSAQRDPNVILGIFDGLTNNLVQKLTINLSGSENPNKTSYNPCISQPVPKVCYIIDTYTTTVDLPNNGSGYTLTVQRCCRIIGIVNLSGNSNDYGVSYTTKIPGKISGTDYSNNSSPVFAQKDTALICYSAPFTFDFSATDPDGDDIVYTFCDGIGGGDNTAAGAKPDPPSAPPYNNIPYNTPLYSGSSPLGSSVTIDSKTGIISGIAPPTTGDYVLSVCANEYRNGVLIGVTKKEIHVTVGNCSIAAASLKPTYITCNGTTLSFQNESTSSNITSYLWDFGVATLTSDTSTNPTPKYDYLQSGKDSGTYTVKLKVTSSGGCQDSTTAQVKVYPGFVPKFTVTGSCYYNNYLFKDATTSKYGTVNNWKWDFGDLTTQADTARSKDSAWKYPAPATVQVKLVVSNSNGCVDTSTQSLTILDKPTLSLPFRDTLICSNDTLALKVNINSGTILWQAANGPNQSRILNTSSNSPLVYPQDTTRYYVTIKDNGCTNTDSVNVNVLQFITVKAGVDTGICLTDTFRLNPTSDALSYQWTASSGVAVQNIKRPLIQPLVNTHYYVTANLGKCQATDSVLVKVVPYPQANAGIDAVICYGSRVQLTGNIVGTNFTWSPTASLIKENTLSPVAGPTKTTAYILRVTDTIGCPKPKSDTVLITVIPQIIADAGKDTSVLINQPLQMNASGGITYAWTPTTGLSNPAIANPIAIFDDKTTDITYTVRVGEGSCYSEDQVTVHVFKTGPDILVPSAFTPNGDGKNDVSKPVLLGIIKLSYFSIYNRWGVLLFSTNEENKGWDGNFNGVAQPPGTYVYQALGTDYLGNPVIRKGTIVLIR